MNNYRRAAIADIKEWAEEGNASAIEPGDFDALREALADPYQSDAITGNASGSYFCNAARAAEELDRSGVIWSGELAEWLDNLGINLGDEIARGPEVVDVLARCCAVDQLTDEDLAEALGWDN